MGLEYDAIVISCGTGGTALAAALAGKNKRVLGVERSKKMFGGSCPNVACLPTKLLLHLSALCAGGGYDAGAPRYAQAIEEKRLFVADRSRDNHDSLAEAGVDLIVGDAAFADENCVEITTGSGVETARADLLVIDTGAVPTMPSIPGLDACPAVYTSETLMELDTLPRHLIIIGAGYIGLEFAGIYRNFGSAVTMVDAGDTFLPHEDEELAHSVAAHVAALGIYYCGGATVEEVRPVDGGAEVRLCGSSGRETLTADAVLVAVGRTPNTCCLHLERAGVDVNQDGGVVTDRRLRTSQSHIYAIGDAAGGMQFTYIAHDDYRIVMDDLFGNGERTTENRGAVPFATFFTPPLARVGLTEKKAREAGHNVECFSISASHVPKALVLGRNHPVGLLKAVVDPSSQLLLGMHLFCEEAHEILHLGKVAIDKELPYTYFRDMVIAHPTMSEAMNNLFS